jgi:hypothetical protein
MALLENKGFGVQHLCDVGNCESFSQDYPQATYQFMASYDTRITNSSSDGHGFYVAAHDPNGASKNFACTVSNEKASFAIRAMPPGAGSKVKSLPYSYTMSYSIVVGVFQVCSFV